MSNDWLITHTKSGNEDRRSHANMRLSKHRIVTIARPQRTRPDEKVLDATGLRRLPGMIGASGTMRVQRMSIAR